MNLQNFARVEEDRAKNIRNTSKKDDEMESRRSRSRSRRGNKTQNVQNQVPIVQPNVFSSLNNDVNEHELVNSNNPNNLHVNRNNYNVKKVPPITVEGLNMKRVQEILTKIPYLSVLPHVKNTIHGHHSIYPRCLSDHNRIEKYLRDNKISGYTHEIEQRNKFVIYGLHSVDTNELKEELTKILNISPVHVYAIPIKSKKYTDQNVYVVHFMKSCGVTLNKLRFTKALFNVIVQWEIYQPNRRNNPNDVKPPTQCSNCQSFNHGSRNCFKPPKCIRCGDNHKSADCVHLLVINELGEYTGKKDKIDTNLVKCANCGERHTANFRGCKVRQQIMNNRSQLRQKSQQFRSQPPPPMFNDYNYPPPPPPSQPIGNNSWKNTTTTTNHVSNSFNCKNNNDLFSYETCNAILGEFISRLSTSKTKLDQLQIIGDIAFKYLYV